MNVFHRDSLGNYEPTEKDRKFRCDLSTWFIFTIGEVDEAYKDIAFSLTKIKSGNWLLGVHVSDVTFFLSEGSALDLESWQRAKNVTFPSGETQSILPTILVK